MTCSAEKATLPVPLSIIVISRGRPDRLARCLKALVLQDHPQIEVVVVADPAGLSAARAVLGAGFRAVPHDFPGVAVARNAGLVQAGFAVVACIDDDAVAEPTWARRLSAPFADPDVVAATGVVRGPRGIMAEWSGSVIDKLARERPLGAPDDETSVHRSHRGAVVVTIGTNCAFRRDDVLATGGFDPAFRYYLEESDLNARMADAGAMTAFVPDAVVHHMPAANATRRQDRTVTNLCDIGHSVALYLRRHADAADMEAAWQLTRSRYRQRLLRQMVAGRLMPDRLNGVMATLEEGFEAGRALQSSVLPPLSATAVSPVVLPGTGPRRGTLVAGRSWEIAEMRRRARLLAADGQIVTVLALSPTGLPHGVTFSDGGWWEQHGGLFRIAESVTRKLHFCGFSGKVQRERQRVAATRPT